MSGKEINASHDEVESLARDILMELVKRESYPGEHADGYLTDSSFDLAVTFYEDSAERLRTRNPEPTDKGEKP